MMGASSSSSKHGSVPLAPIIGDRHRASGVSIVSDHLVGEKGEAVADHPGADEAHRLLVAGLPQEAFACAEHHREDEHPEVAAVVEALRSQTRPNN